MLFWKHYFCFKYIWLKLELCDGKHWQYEISMRMCSAFIFVLKQVLFMMTCSSYVIYNQRSTSISMHITDMILQITKRVVVKFPISVTFSQLLSLSHEVPKTTLHIMSMIGYCLYFNSMSCAKIIWQDWEAEIIPFPKKKFNIRNSETICLDFA